MLRVAPPRTPGPSTEVDSSAPDAQHSRIDPRRRVERLARHLHAEVQRVRVREPAGCVVYEPLRRRPLQNKIGGLELSKRQQPTDELGRQVGGGAREDRKSTRLNSSNVA